MEGDAFVERSVRQAFMIVTVPLVIAKRSIADHLGKAKKRLMSDTRVQMDVYYEVIPQATLNPHLWQQRTNHTS